MSSTCANCGAAKDAEAVFSSRCGLNFTIEFKGTPLADVKEVSPTLMRLRENLAGRYIIERELGSGGMATVFLARDIKHDREVAIKVLHPDLSASIGAERFEREIKLAARLHHPHILGLYDSGVADDLLYYVMPYVRGESLRDRLTREGMLPIDDAVRITLEVCDALGYAHAQGVVHRDIKPENILLSGDHALIADFGIARAATEAGKDKLTQTGMAVGTPTYMAPEQSTGDNVGPAADLYSLGCMLYEMLAGEPPFTGPNAMAIMARHLMEQVPSIRVVRNAVPEEIENTIFIALNKQAVDRPQTSGEFAALMGMPIGATGTMRVMRSTAARARMTPADFPASVLPVPVPFWKRPAALAGAMALVLVVGGGTWAFKAFAGGAGPAVDPNARRVAVLYFGDESRDSSLGPVADGLTESLIRALDRSSSITVVSRGGADAFRGSSASAPEIADSLRAGYLVRGEVEPMSDGNRVQVSVQLLHSSGVTVERQSFDVARDSLLLMQDSLGVVAANLIGRALKTDLSLQRQRSATSDAAWLVVQEGVLQQREAEAARLAGEGDRATQDFVAADSSYARAERLDPRWVDPVTHRAALAYRRSRVAQAEGPAAIRRWVDVGIQHADRALAMAPGDPDALEMRGTLRYWGVLAAGDADDAKVEADMKLAQADLELATSQNPDQAGAWNTLSHMYNLVPGKGAADVLIAAKEALRADEFQSNANVVRQRLFTAAYDLGQFELAGQYCDDLHARYPADERAVRCRLYMLSVPGRADWPIERAWQLADSLVAVTAPRDTARARVIADMLVAATIARAASAPGVGAGDSGGALADSARHVATRAEGDASVDPQRESAMYGAYVSTILGDTDEALRRLTIYISVNTSRADGLRENPGWFFRPIADEPGFRRLVGATR